MNITEDYCSKEIYKLLIKKGFNGEIHTAFDEEGYTQPSITHQMAMKWLREVHKIFIAIIPRLFYSDGSCDSFAYSIWADDNLDVDGEEEWDELYESYEDAVEAALKYSLERLI